MKINVLTENGTTAGQGFNSPLRKGAKALMERGFDLEFFWDTPSDERLCECDCLFINSKVFRSWWTDRKEEMFERFDTYRNGVGKVLYFDTTDSSGTLQADLLPYVTGYMKSYLLKDGRAYLKPFYGGRVFTDFYHRTFGVKDREEITSELQQPAKEEDLGKLGVSWNSALTYGGGWKQAIRGLFGSRYTPPSRSRPLDLTCRMSVNHKRETIRYQRERIAELVGGFGVKVDRVGKSEYFMELKDAKIAVSPFGWGEFSYRDFEVFSHGCMLLKPDISHLDTWPALYEEGQTYIGFSWDFKDFRETVSALLSDPGRALGIAENGQERYRWFLESEEASSSFCDHLAAIVKNH